jgi:ribosome recycling factor
MDFLKKQEKDGDHQPGRSSRPDRVQKLTDDTINQIDSLLANKEAEIMQV